MKKLTLWMMALAALQGITLQAQNITGDWQGTLEVPQRKVRLIFKIGLENDKLTATIYTVDQASPPIATTIRPAASRAMVPAWPVVVVGIELKPAVPNAVSRAPEAVNRTTPTLTPWLKVPSAKLPSGSRASFDEERLVLTEESPPCPK